MLLVLPPSETKRDGGLPAGVLDLDELGFPELRPERVVALRALRTLSRNLGAATIGLGLGAKQRFEIDRNRVVTTSPVMPALERYTGVLFDGLAADTLTPQQREFAEQHVIIHSALFGLVRAGDPIPAYRLSHNSRLPKLSLRTHWRGPVSAALASHRGLVLDLRSEAYVTLGPAPPDALYLRVVSEDGAGRRVALSHFNKKAKGEFTRAVIEAGVVHEDAESLLRWAAGAGVRLEPGAPGELELVV